MISISFPGKLTLGMKIIYGIVAVGIIGTIIAVIAFNRSSYLANTMRLVRTQGDVRIVSAGGGSKAAAKNKRFESGDVLVTGVNDSLASVSLDDSKIVTLQADSKAEFVKKNKQIVITSDDVEALEEERYTVPYGYKIKVREGDHVKAGQPLELTISKGADPAKAEESGFNSGGYSEPAAVSDYREQPYDEIVEQAAEEHTPVEVTDRVVDNSLPEGTVLT